ncbi:hypothetical protein PG997_008770 [Apiospora hydei]|uniref:Uncharacterized protein n=1 Tax=Apiospora hydei TaxID=1337664 RepID=A0ABR1WC04_9PEZI
MGYNYGFIRNTGQTPSIQDDKHVDPPDIPGLIFYLFWAIIRARTMIHGFFVQLEGNTMEPDEELQKSNANHRNTPCWQVVVHQANDQFTWQENEIRYDEEDESDRRAMYFELKETRRRQKRTRNHPLKPHATQAEFQKLYDLLLQYLASTPTG